MNKKSLSAIIASVAAATALSGAAFAETVPVYLTAEATPIDVEVGTGLDNNDLTDPDGRPNTGDEYWTVDPDGRPNTGDEYNIPVSVGSNAVFVHAERDTNDANVTNLHVKNNVTSSPIYVKGVALSNITSGYTNTPFTDDYSVKAVNSKAFGLAITKKGSTALQTPADLKTGYSGSDLISANGEIVYTLTGKVSATSTAINNAKIADCIVTISQSGN